MAITYSTLRKPDNPQVIDPLSGQMREEWQLYFGQLTTRVNAAVGELEVDDAPADAEYLVGAAASGLSAERLATNSTTNTWNLATPGQAAVERAALTGDVTASANSNATTIANDAVTYAKMQNISATSRILGRKTSGAGDTEECTLSEVLDFIGSAAQGDILYRGASAWARLAAGSTNRQRLLTGGASANPSWGGGIVTLASGSLPAAANFDITDIPSIYTSLILHVVNISHNSGSNQRPIVQLSTNNGSSFHTTEYRNSGVNASGAGAITAPATDNMISEPSSGTGNSSAQWIATVHLFNYAGGVFPFYMSGLDRVGTNHYLLNGRFTSTTAVNAIRVAFSGGSIDAGTYALYGAL